MINPVFLIPDFIPSQNIQFVSLKLVNNQAKGHVFHKVTEPPEHTISNKFLKQPTKQL